MHTRILVAIYVFLAVAVMAMPSSAADDEELKKDLTAVIALHGLPCGQVVTVTVQAENDFAVSCADANKYRVYMNAEGRVLVEKRQ